MIYHIYCFYLSILLLFIYPLFFTSYIIKLVYRKIGGKVSGIISKEQRGCSIYFIYRVIFIFLRISDNALYLALSRLPLFIPKFSR